VDTGAHPWLEPARCVSSSVLRSDCAPAKPPRPLPGLAG
jgi:hypothetical protein